MTKPTNAAGTKNILSMLGDNSYQPTASTVAVDIAAKDKDNARDGAKVTTLRAQVSVRVLQQTADVAAFIAFQGLDTWNKVGASDMRKALVDAKVSKIVAKRLTESAGAFLKAMAETNPATLEAFAHGPSHVLSYFANLGIKSQADLIKKFQPKQAAPSFAEQAFKYHVDMTDAEFTDYNRKVAAARKDKAAKDKAAKERKAALEKHAKAQRDARRVASAKPGKKSETVSAEAS
jgi:hypothetical protein